MTAGDQHSETSDAPNGLIAGRYRLGELLGTGGTASVFSATDVTIGMTADAEVALKILHPHLANSNEARQAIFREARAAMVLTHPNVAASFDVGVHDVGDGMVAWIAMQRAPGVTLSDLVQADGPLRLGDALSVADAVLRALEAAHDIGLIHRDVSPANIMVERNADGSVPVDGVRLLDFGLADAAGRSTVRVDTQHPERQGILGSANYTSPEQAHGEPVDERGDLYQLGGVLHFALTGQPPFLRSTVQATLAAHLHAPPPVPSVSRGEIPRQVDRIVVKAMLKDADGRFQRAAEMREAVIAAREPLSAPDAAARYDAAHTRVLGVGTEAEGRTVVLPEERARMAVKVSAKVARTPRRSARRRAGNSAGTLIAGLVVSALIGTAWLLASASPASVMGEQTAAALPPSDEPTSSAPTPAATPSRDTRPTVARVPALEMTTLADAREALAAVGLTVGTLTIQNSTYPGDTVLVVSPAQGSPLPIGGVVDVVVASGSNTVPDVRGMSRADATVALQAAGFAVTVRSAVTGGEDQTDASSVLDTVPAAPATVRLGVGVALLLAPATPAPTPVPQQTSTPTPTPTPERPAAALSTRANLSALVYAVVAR